MKQPRLTAEEKVEAVLAAFQDVRRYHGRLIRLPTNGQIVGLGSPEAKGFLKKRIAVLELQCGRDVVRAVLDRLAFECSTAPEPPEDADYVALTEEELAARCWEAAQPLGFRYRAPRLTQWKDRDGEIHVVREYGCWLLNDQPENTLAIERMVRSVLNEIAAQLDDRVEQCAITSAHKQAAILRILESMAAVGAEDVLPDGRTMPEPSSEPDDPFGPDSLFDAGRWWDKVQP